MAAWLVVGLVMIGAGLVLSRHIRANRRRIAELEGLVEELSEAERIIARANGRRDRSHLKLLGLIPVGWLFGTSRRVLAVTAATVTLTGAGYLATDGTQQAPGPAVVPPAEAAESETTGPGTPRRPVTTIPGSTTTTSIDPAAAVTPPAAAAATGPTPSLPSPPSASAPSTTTTLPVEVTVDTTIPVVPVELPRPCLNPQVVEVGIRLCPAG